MSEFMPEKAHEKAHDNVVVVSEFMPEMAYDNVVVMSEDEIEKASKLQKMSPLFTVIFSGTTPIPCLQYGGDIIGS